MKRKHIHRPALVVGTKAICATCMQVVTVAPMNPSPSYLQKEVA